MMWFFKRKTPSPPPVAPKSAPEKTASMQRPEVLSQLREQDLTAIYHVATMQHYQQDDSILVEGVECRALYIIMNGTVRLTDRYGVYHVTLHKGDFFGEMPGKDQGRNLYIATALTQVSVMAIDDSAVGHLSENIQLLMYKKLNRLAGNTLDTLARRSHTLQACNAQLTAYIHSMCSKTNVFISSEAFQNLIKSIPKLPKCAGSLSARLMEENVSAKEVTEAVQEEPALAAAILKTVNSAYYGLQEKVSSLHHAILYLGFNEVYQLILENSLKNIMPYDEEYEQIRLHSYMISLMANEIATLCQKSRPLLNATVGILHDVGKIITLLLRHKYPNLQDVISMVDESKIGACLLRSWEFPDNILSIIEEQYTPGFAHPAYIHSEYKDELAILYLAHVCYDVVLGEKTTSTIFVDEYLALLDLAPYSCEAFCQLKLVPALLKNKKRLPEKIATLLHEQALAADMAFRRAS